MSTETIIFIVLTILVLGVAFYFIKSFIQAVFVTLLVVLIFRVGWVYSADEVIHLFRLDSIMEEEKVEEFEIFFEDFRKRSSENQILIPEKIDNALEEELREKMDEFLQKNE